MTPSLEVAHVRSSLAVIRWQELVELAVVPHVSGGHLDGTSETKILGARTTTPQGNVLTITASTLCPIWVSASTSTNGNAWS